MGLEDFRVHLKKMGKKKSVVDRNVRTVLDFLRFIEDKTLSNKDISTEDIDSYIKSIEENGDSAKGPLYVLMNYFKYLGFAALYSHSAMLREERTKKNRRIFPLKDFLDIEPDTIEKLNSVGIKNVHHMLDRGKTKKQRMELASSLGIPMESILELVILSDITRIGYVKAKLSRLYYNAGIRSAKHLGEFEVDKLYEFFKEYVERSGWDGMIPNKADLNNNIQNAKKLDSVIEL